MLVSCRVLSEIYIYAAHHVYHRDEKKTTSKPVEVMMLVVKKPFDLKSIHEKILGLHFLNKTASDTTCNSLWLVQLAPRTPSRGMLPLLCLPCPGQKWKKGPRRVVHYHGTPPRKKHQKSMLSCSMDFCGCCFHCFILNQVVVRGVLTQDKIPSPDNLFQQISTYTEFIYII